MTYNPSSILDTHNFHTCEVGSWYVFVNGFVCEDFSHIIYEF